MTDRVRSAEAAAIDDALNIESMRAEAATWVAPVDRYTGPRTSDPLTSGPWQTEAEALAALDAILARCGLFTVVAEAAGVIMQLRPDQADEMAREGKGDGEGKGLRVYLDRLLLPGPELVAAGWHHGAIGIEAKRPGEKIGQPLAQMLDYGRSVFRSPAGGWVWPSWIFLWHLDTQYGPVASMMAQSRLGSACRYRRGIDFNSGGGRVLTIGAAGDFTIGKAVRNGKRTGSR